MEAAPQSSAQEIASIRNKIQIALALEACREAHPDFSEQDVRKQAMKEWVGENPDDPSSLAARFSDYLEDETHAHEQINMADPGALKALLENVRKFQPKPDTLH